MPRPLLTTLVIGAGVAGCGDGAEQRQTLARTSERPVSADERPLTDQVKLRRLAERYLSALRANDPEGLCATLTPRAQARLARKAGSCPASYRQVLTPQARRDARGLRVDHADINGDRARIGIALPTSSQADLYYYAAKLDGRWRLYIRRAAKGAP